MTGHDGPKQTLSSGRACAQVTVTFNADVSDGMNWRFKPTQRAVKVRPPAPQSWQGGRSGWLQAEQSGEGRRAPAIAGGGQAAAASEPRPGRASKPARKYRAPAIGRAPARRATRGCRAGQHPAGGCCTAAAGRRPAARGAPQVRPGQSTLVFYTAHNLSDHAVTGVSTYNVAPQQAGLFFNKIQCFCFEEQKLRPGAPSRARAGPCCP